jgi:hypothetical protein
MNSLAKFIASISALIASLSFAWIALTITGIIQNHVTRVTMYHKGEIDLGGGFELNTGSGSFDITHEGSIEVTR